MRRALSGRSADGRAGAWAPKNSSLTQYQQRMRIRQHRHLRKSVVAGCGRRLCRRSPIRKWIPRTYLTPIPSAAEATPWRLTKTRNLPCLPDLDSPPRQRTSPFSGHFPQLESLGARRPECVCARRWHSLPRNLPVGSSFPKVPTLRPPISHHVLVPGGATETHALRSKLVLPVGGTPAHRVGGSGSCLGGGPVAGPRGIRRP
jgi:hypothetical protein